MAFTGCSIGHFQLRVPPTPFPHSITVPKGKMRFLKNRKGRWWWFHLLQEFPRRPLLSAWRWSLTALLASQPSPSTAGRGTVPGWGCPLPVRLAASQALPRAQLPGQLPSLPSLAVPGGTPAPRPRFPPCLPSRAPSRGDHYGSGCPPAPSRTPRPGRGPGRGCRALTSGAARRAVAAGRAGAGAGCADKGPCPRGGEAAALRGAASSRCPPRAPPVAEGPGLPHIRVRRAPAGGAQVGPGPGGGLRAQAARRAVPFVTGTHPAVSRSSGGAPVAYSCSPRPRLPGCNDIHLRPPRRRPGGAAVAAPGQGAGLHLQAGLLAVAVRGGSDHPMETQVPARGLLRAELGQKHL